MLLRKIGKVVRGSASFPQILVATVLGGMLGFVPGFFLPSDLGGGFLQAPGLIATLLALVLVLDANLAVFGLTTLVAKAASFALLPLSFQVGRVLLDGPTEPLFRRAVNAPVLAWFGFERYATTGGVVVGAAFGLLTGLLVWRAIHALRVRMADVEEDSPRYRAWMQKRSVRLLTWLVLGKGHGKRTWRELATSDRKAHGVRWAGVVVVVLAFAGLWALQATLGSAWLHERARTALARWNGATVDVAGVTLDVGGGRVAIDGLAMADAERLERDVFRARSLDLDVATDELLARRVVVDHLVSSEAASGLLRDRPAERITPPAPSPTEPEPNAQEPQGRSLEELIARAEAWKQRLRTAAEWIERLWGGEPASPNETPAERDARVAAQKEQLGLVGVVATHLLRDHPAVMVRDLRLEDVGVADLDGARVDVVGENLSSAPALADAPAKLSVRAADGSFTVDLRYDPAQPNRSEVFVQIPGLSLDTLTAQLEERPVRGGTVDLQLSGTLDLEREGGPWFDLPLIATLHDTTITAGGAPTPVAALTVPIGLSGSLRSPRVSIDASALADALTQAGRKELAARVRAHAGDLLEGYAPGAGEALGGLIDGGADAAEVMERAKAEAEEKAKQRAQEALQKHLPQGLGGLLDKKEPPQR